MEYWLPIIFFFLMGFSLFVYVILDGYDLGIGLLLPFAEDSEKDTMIASIGPFWDANETWIVLGVGILLIAFPTAHGKVLTTLYLPVTFMLMGLILRGVAFDFRVKAGDQHKPMWNRLFFFGSFVTTLCQGWMIGAYITGLHSSMFTTLFSIFVAITLPSLYVMLGASWLLIKTEGELFNKSLRWARVALLPMGIALILVSIATPIVSNSIAVKWFSIQNFIGLIPIPFTTVITYLGVAWLLTKVDILKNGWGWLPMAGVVVICIMAGIGLAYSLYPYIIIDQMKIWEAAADKNSLLVILVGVCITMPMIIIYTGVVYYIFRGKSSKLTYGLD
jgi:cytochrome d ubiquinol oxidase subunit II